MTSEGDTALSPDTDEDEWLAVTFDKTPAESRPPGRFQVDVDSQSVTQLVIRWLDASLVTTLEKIEDFHAEMTALFPSTTAASLPTLPKRPTGIWSYLSSFSIPKTTCADLETYLNDMTTRYPQSVVREKLFGVSSDDDQYLMSLSDFNKSRADLSAEEAKRNLFEVLEMRNGAKTSDDVAALYAIEDEAIQEFDKWELKLRELDERPFDDLKDIEHSKRMFHRERSLDKGLGKDEQLEAVGEEHEATQEYVRAQQNLLDLKEEKFVALIDRTVACIQRMAEDRERFDDWTHWGQDRLSVYEEKLVNLTVELLKVRLKKLRFLKDEKLLDIAFVKEGEANFKESVEKLEKAFYELHMKWLDVSLMCLDEQEKQVKYAMKRLDGESNALERLKNKEGKLSSHKSNLRNQKVSFR